MLASMTISFPKFSIINITYLLTFVKGYGKI
nr:MAG TPA: hypothetical protein [Caudoviricetes sp.]